MQNEDLPNPKISNTPQQKRPWIAIVPLALTGFLFLALTFYFIILFFVGKNDADPKGFGIAIASFSILSALTFFVCYKLYQRPNRNSRTKLPLWFIRGFGIVMLIGLIAAFWQNKIGGVRFGQGLLLFIGIIISGDVVDWWNPNSKNPDYHHPNED